MGKKNRKFVFPKCILNQLDECSNGGFVLFSFDADGIPQMHVSFEHPQSALALQYYITNYSTAVQQINLENTIKNITDTEEEPPAE